MLSALRRILSTSRGQARHTISTNELVEKLSVIANKYYGVFLASAQIVSSPYFHNPVVASSFIRAISSLTGAKPVSFERDVLGSIENYDILMSLLRGTATDVKIAVRNAKMFGAGVSAELSRIVKPLLEYDSMNEHELRVAMKRARRYAASVIMNRAMRKISSNTLLLVEGTTIELLGTSAFTELFHSLSTTNKNIRLLILPPASPAPKYIRFLLWNDVTPLMSIPLNCNDMKWITDTIVDNRVAKAMRLRRGAKPEIVSEKGQYSTVIESNPVFVAYVLATDVVPGIISTTDPSETVVSCTIPGKVVKTSAEKHDWPVFRNILYSIARMLGGKDPDAVEALAKKVFGIAEKLRDDGIVVVRLNNVNMQIASALYRLGVVQICKSGDKLTITSVDNVLFRSIYRNN